MSKYLMSLTMKCFEGCEIWLKNFFLAQSRQLGKLPGFVEPLLRLIMKTRKGTDKLWMCFLLSP